MAKIKDTYTAKIAQDFACVIEYGYSDTHTNDEVTAVFEWVERYTSEGHAVFSYSEDTHFAKCDICGLGATCVNVTITIFEKE
jgi:hypothetical protein